MVKLGFIVEGDTEMVFIKRNEAFKQLLAQLGIEIVALVDGCGGELLNENLLNSKKQICKDANASHIIILTDLDEETCFTNKKSKLDLNNINSTVISRQSFEAWFLADTSAIRQVIGNPEYYCELPQEIKYPYEEIKRLAKIHQDGKGVGSKPFLAGKMNNNGFDLSNAAKHENCPSAKYFLDKLKAISTA